MTDSNVISLGQATKLAVELARQRSKAREQKINGKLLHEQQQFTQQLAGLEVMMGVREAHQWVHALLELRR
jgi:hypothetical protein